MPTLYNIYIGVLTERLSKEVEENVIVPPSYTGFKKGIGVMENTYVMNFSVNRQLKRKGGMVVAVFENLKAAFDSVDRKVLIEVMMERGVREGLRSTIEKVYRETRSKVMVGKRIGNNFWTTTGIRQECPMSSCFFNPVITDVEEVLRRESWGE